MPRHEAGYGCRCEIEPELEKLTVNARRAPRRILIGRAANEFSNSRALLRAPTGCTALPRPEQFETLAMPAGRPERAVDPGESGAIRLSFQDGQLLPQGQVFQSELALPFEARSCWGEEGKNQVQHARTGA